MHANFQYHALAMVYHRNRLLQEAFMHFWEFSVHLIVMTYFLFCKFMLHYKCFILEKQQEAVD